MKGLDTNVLLRYMVRDDPEQYQTAALFLQKHCGNYPGFINRVVLCEFVWVLESFYEYSREQIAGALEKIFSTEHFIIEDVDLAWQALKGYRTARADFADCLIGRVNRRAGCTRTATFDKTAGRLEEFELL